MSIREILKVHFEPINPYDSLKLYNVKKSGASQFLKYQDRILKFQFCFSDGAVTNFAMILDAPKVEKEFYDKLLSYSDNFAVFSFWLIKNGEIYFHRVSKNERMRSTDGDFYVLEMYPLNPSNVSNLSFFWFDMTPSFERKLLDIIRENLNAELYVDDLATKIGASPNRVGIALQRLGILNRRVYAHGKHRRKIVNSVESLKTICDRMTD